MWRQVRCWSDLTVISVLRDLTGLRLLNRYDAEGIDEATYQPLPVQAFFLSRRCDAVLR